MPKWAGKKCRLLSMLGLTTSFFFVEIVVGYITNSMALVADSFHMLSDVAALMVAFVSVKMSPKKWSKNTFGWARAEVLGALVNAVFLVALCFSITVEACKRFIESEAIHDPQLLVIVGALGLFVNCIGLLLFHEHGSSHGHSHGRLAHSRNRLTQLAMTDDNENDESYPSPPPEKSSHHGHSSPGQMNMRGVFLHVLSDALGSVIVIISAVVFWLSSWKYRNYIDPALSILLVLLIMNSVWPLLRDSALILLQTVPTHIQVDAIQRRLLAKVDGVVGVHEFHVWQLAGDRIIASAHIKCRNLSEYMKIAEKVKEFFHNEGIHSTTIQPEFIDYQAPEITDTDQTEDCVLDCPKTTDSDDCVQNTCCGPSKQLERSLLKGRETPSPNNTPYMVRQRGNSSNSSNNSQEMNEMEAGVLLEKGNSPVPKDYNCISRGSQCSQYSVRPGSEPSF
ncbi:proton-coupled zinc antiporter SLC30A1 isoform X1 [Tribolium castaneum]|uniref:proton-coupled zinc antiporter SLC30A1 isoform X1 n=1 Tax=Tribolium castaneum TaxID=7070 RepID=UPI00077DDE14|nr:PREDICTED: zinc transporter 1 isoform X1 [Tribolium castaneum]XP_015834688.1 PREDICTED: zinc transporter 1 isoform X1 [Tribolium castaneum]|eukprot:XP_015834687.1 PREDICTED: zinc transporter 1 isoform X1 [Tribolium castaneum]